MINVTTQELEQLKKAVCINYLVEYQAGNSTFRFTASDSIETYNGEDYLPGYISYGGIDEIEVTSDLKLNNTSINIDAADNAIIGPFLSPGWMNKPCSIIKVITDPDGNALLNKVVFEGLLSSISINSKKSVIKITASSIWADYEKVSGIKTNNKSQQRFYPTDTAFEHSQAATKKVYWGSDAPRLGSGVSGGGFGSDTGRIGEAPFSQA